MSLYQLQRLLDELNRDDDIKRVFVDKPADVMARYELTAEERSAIEQGDIGLLYVLGVSGQILAHFAAFLGIARIEYLELMRKGVQKHGPVRAGIHAMPGSGTRFEAEDQQQ